MKTLSTGLGTTGIIKYSQKTTELLSTSQYHSSSIFLFKVLQLVPQNSYQLLPLSYVAYLLLRSFVLQSSEKLNITNRRVVFARLKGFLPPRQRNPTLSDRPFHLITKLIFIRLNFWHVLGNIIYSALIVSVQDRFLLLRTQTVFVPKLHILIELFQLFLPLVKIISTLLIFPPFAHTLFKFVQLFSVLFPPFTKFRHISLRLIPHKVNPIGLVYFEVALNRLLVLYSFRDNLTRILKTQIVKIMTQLLLVPSHLLSMGLHQGHTVKQGLILGIRLLSILHRKLLLPYEHLQILKLVYHQVVNLNQVVLSHRIVQLENLQESFNIGNHIQ